MQKLIILMVSLLISSIAFASVTFSTTPLLPVVISSDFTYQNNSGSVTVQGPWFSLQYQITTDQLITVVGIQEIITAQDGSTTSYYLKFPKPIEITAESNFKTDIQYLGNLKQQNGYNYNVTARLVGWFGSNSSCGPLLNSILKFQTQ